MRGVRCEPETIFQITTFGTWKHVDSISHTSGVSLSTSTNSPCYTPAVVMADFEQIISYPRQVLQHTASGILLSVSSMR